MNKQLLLLPFFFILFACGEAKSSNSQPFVDEPGWRESGLYRASSETEDALYRVEGVDGTVFVLSLGGAVFYQYNQSWVQLEVPEQRKVDVIKKVGTKLLVGFSWDLALYAYDPVQREWRIGFWFSGSTRNCPFASGGLSCRS